MDAWTAGRLSDQIAATFHLGYGVGDLVFLVLFVRHALARGNKKKPHGH